MTLSKRILSPRFWRRAVTALGVSGAVQSGLRALKPRPRAGADPGCRDLVGITDDLIEAMYLAADVNQMAVVLVPMAHLRLEKLGTRVDDVNANPFTRTVAEFLSGEHPDYEGSVLQRYFAAWHPESLAELLGLDSDSPESLLSEPLRAPLLPWQSPATNEELEERRKASERSWALKFGLPPDGRHGSTSYGPTSEALGRYRFTKHADVATSIAREAATEDMSDPRWWDPKRGGYIEIQMLLDGGRVCGIVREGKHRTAALAALGAKSLIVAIPPTYPVVRRVDVMSWPGVRSGVFTADQALQVFDRFMEGAPPKHETFEPAHKGEGQA